MMKSGVDQVRGCILGVIERMGAPGEIELRVHPDLHSIAQECMPEYVVVADDDIVCFRTPGGEYTSDIWVVEREAECPT